YMLPSYFMRLAKIPLTPSGKLDRKALPEPKLKSEATYVAPRNEMEKKLVEIWGKVLGKDISLNPIGIDDHFFRLGGHSLKATALASLLYKTFDVKIPLGEIFKRPTIRQLFGYINNAVKEQYIVIEPVEKREYYPLSSAQKRLYFLQQMDNAGAVSTVYNMPSVWMLEGEPDKSYLEKVFNKLIMRHESLRTSFIIIDEEPVQQIHDEVEFEIECFATDEHGQTGPIIKNFMQPFDLSKVPLLRVGLLKEKGDRHFLLVDMHHIISDGTSQNIMVKEFLALYREEDLAGLKIQYKDFARWQNHEKQKELLKPQENYWANEFVGEIPVLELPTDYPRPPVQSFAGSSIHFEIDSATTEMLNRLALITNATMYMILLAVYTVFLTKITNQEDIVVGSPIAGRRHADLEKMIGMFVNSLAMRNFPFGEKTFTGFLYEVKEKTLRAFENQDYPFEDLVEQIVTNRDTSRNPVFDVMFVLQNMGLPEMEIPGLILKPYDYENKTAKFDLNLTGLEKEGKLIFNLEYSTNLFKKENALRLSDYFKNLIHAICQKPESRISALEIMSSDEKKRILEISNGMVEPVDFSETIHGMFENITSGNEDKTALVFKNARITYGELNRRANILAQILQNVGIGIDCIVGLMVERSFELVTGMIGIMKAGGAYLPIDPHYPQERIDYMLKDSNAKILINKSESPRRGRPIKDINIQNPNDPNKNEYFENVLVLDFERLNFDIVSNFDIRASDLISSNLGYVIYTSGSTGRPKGAMLEHINLVNLIRFHNRYTGINCNKVLQFATISFDASFHEIFSALLAGGELYLIDEEIRNNITLLLKYIDKNKIKTLFLPMAFLKIIFNDDDYLNIFPKSVEHIQSAGEQVVVSEKFKNYLKENNIYLHNHYGPSETHVITTFTINPREDIPEFPSIGKPIQNTGIYILDKTQQLLPIGVAGELYAGGLQVGRGYLNNLELTLIKFSSVSSVSSVPSVAKIYK
ncbi:MAG: condensation domain-containing protein, partial [Acidobacteria bacterium]|nr:condensation domain-containing protein [Acidobacteriota bacterium]